METTTAPITAPAPTAEEERQSRIRAALAIKPRPKASDEKIDLLLEILHEARENGDDVLLLQVIQQATGALTELHAERARAAAQSQP
jgi:hypothetical protein